MNTQKTKPGFTSPDSIKKVQEMQLPSDRMATPEEMAEQAAAAHAVEAVGKDGSAEIPKNTGVVTKATATAKVAKAPARNIKVKATQKGWFDNKRKKAGEAFVVSADEFSDVWMEKL